MGKEVYRATKKGYRTLYLSEIANSADASAILNTAATQSGKDITLQVKAGTSIADPALGAYFTWKAKDIFGDYPSHPWSSPELLLEVTTPPGASSDFAIAIGICDNADLTAGENTEWASLIYDNATGPKIRVGQGTTVSTGTAAAGRVKLHSMILDGPGATASPNKTTLWRIAGFGLDSSDLLVGNASSGTAADEFFGDAHVFISVFRISALGGTETAVVKAGYRWWPTRKGGYNV